MQESTPEPQKCQIMMELHANVEEMHDYILSSSDGEDTTAEDASASLQLDNYQQEAQCTNLLDLSPTIIGIISSMLNTADLKKFGSVNKQMNVALTKATK